jgi:hypothetical protein
LSKVPKLSQPILDDLSDQVLASIDVLSIPLPGRETKPNETWKSRRNVQIGSAVLSMPAQADFVYKFLGVRTLGKKDYGLIEIDGTIRGRRGDGLDMGGSCSGSALVSLDTGEVVQGKLNIKADVDVTFGRKPCKAVGTLDVRIRPPTPEKK